MKNAIFAIATVLAAASAADSVEKNAVAADAIEATTKDTAERELWGKSWYSWKPKEEEECYDFDKCFKCLDECKEKAEYAETKCKDYDWKPDWYSCDAADCTDNAKCIFDKCKYKCPGCSGRERCKGDGGHSSSLKKCKKDRRKCKKKCDRRVLKVGENKERLDERFLAETKRRLGGCVKDCKKDFKKCKKYI